MKKNVFQIDFQISEYYSYLLYTGLQDSNHVSAHFLMEIIVDCCFVYTLIIKDIGSIKVFLAYYETHITNNISFLPEKITDKDNMSAIFNFSSLMTVVLLLICMCTYIHAVMPSILDRYKTGLAGIFWKCARIGERKSPYVAVCCIAMAFNILFLQ